MWYSTTDLDFLFKFIIIGTGLLMLLLTTLIATSGERYQIKIFFVGISIIFILMFSSTNLKGLLMSRAMFTQDHNLIIDKAKEKFNAKKIKFEEDDDFPTYFVEVDGKEYVFTLSDTGVNVDKIWSQGIIVYQSTISNVDEGLPLKARIAMKKLREVIGEEKVKYEGRKSFNQYLGRVEDKIYTINIDDVNLKNPEVESIIHNDKYIYERKD